MDVAAFPTPVRPDHESSARLRMVLDISVGLAAERDLAVVLQRIVESVAVVAGAGYAALGMHGAGSNAKFFHHGRDVATVERLGAIPHELEMSGRMTLAERPIRIADFGRVPMQAFLGAPIARGGRRYGNLYLAEKAEGGLFDADDEALVMTLMAFAACAIESAELVASDRARAEAVDRQVAAEERERTRRELLQAVIAAQEDERGRVSRDLHDEIGQALTSVLLGLRLIDGCGNGEADVGTRAQVDELRELIADALRKTRRLAFELRPTVLDDIGLKPALERLVVDVSDRSGLTVDVAVDGMPDGLPPGVATVVYRVVQEALTNAVRHADASMASVAVTVCSRRLRAVVEDDGVGFDPDGGPDRRLGLHRMKERAEFIGGTVQIVSAPGSGTTIALEIPV